MKAITFSLVFLFGICLLTFAAKAQSDGSASKPPAPPATTDPAATAVAPTSAKTQSTKVTPKKSQFNSQIYEKEKAEASFSAQVKVVREVQGDTQVFFEGVKGFYVLNMSSPSSGSWQSLLVASQTKKFKVQVSVDEDSRQILNVTRGEDHP